MTRSVRTATRTHGFTESVIREMTRVAREVGAINLAQGFPDFPAPDLLKDAACQAIQGDVNQYAITWGSTRMRTALEVKYRRWYGMEIDGDRQITVTCGATEAMAAVVLSIVDPGDEIIVLEPFYENYGPDAILADAKPVFVSLEPPEYRLDPERLEAAVSRRTRAIILNTPNNPTGRVFDADETAAVARLCREHDIIAITDEIYEHILYDGRHLPLATLDGMADRTVTVSGASKTFGVTGWRVGTIVSPPDITDAIRKVHDFLTVGAPAPLQEACAAAIEQLDADYYEGLISGYRERRDVLFEALTEAGFTCSRPQGAYYILADFSGLSDDDDRTFSHTLAREAGVTPVPGSSFFSEPSLGRSLVRFAFCKRLDTLLEASDRLRTFAER